MKLSAHFMKWQNTLKPSLEGWKLVPHHLGGDYQVLP